MISSHDQLETGVPGGDGDRQSAWTHSRGPDLRDHQPRRGSTDEQLLEAYRRGDQGSFEELVKRHRRELFNFLAHFLGDRSAAEDVFQETFLQVHRSAAGYDPSRRFRPWLFAVAANKARDWLRLQRRRPSVPLEAIVRPGAETPQTYAELMEAPAEAPAAQIEKEELRRRVRETVLAMPERLREVLLLSFFHRFSYREISDLLGIPLGTVKSRIHAAVAHFADRWHRLEETEGAEREAFALSAGTGAADPPPPETAAPDPAPPVRTARSVLRSTAPSCSWEPPPDLVHRTLARLAGLPRGSSGRGAVGE